MILMRWGKRWPRWGLLLLWSGAAAAWGQSTPGLPSGMGFVAQDATGAWSLYRVDERQQVQRVPTQLEPRQACVAPDGSKAVYSAADGTVRVAAPAGGAETVIARPDAKRSYTQPCLSTDGRDVVLVEMADGKSLETEILRFGGSPEPARIARQPGAQHDPFLHRGRWLVYANVACSDGCEELLVEIWSRDLLAGKARQLTLLNALSQGPVTDGQRVVFSSNATGTHQIWEVGWDGGSLRRLTSEPTQAINPALCADEVFFVKVGPQGSSLARWSGDGAVQDLPLPGLKSVRALRCLS